MNQTLTDINAELMAAINDAPLPDDVAITPNDEHAALVAQAGDMPQSDPEAALFANQGQVEHAAKLILSSMIDYGDHAVFRGITPAMMPTLETKAILKYAQPVIASGVRGVYDVPAAIMGNVAPAEFETIRGAIFDLNDLGPVAPQPQALRGQVEAIQRHYIERRRWELAAEILRASEDRRDVTALIHELYGLDDARASQSIMDKLAARAFDEHFQPPPPVPVLSLGDKIIATPGNILNIQAPAKAGKSAALSGMLASIFTVSPDADCLGFVAANVSRRAVVHFDTEQSRYDHDALIRRALRRAGARECPEWFYSYSIADLTHEERLSAWREGIKLAHRKHGGTFAVLLDGVADLCRDPNDAEESFDLVGSLHALAIKLDCALITVLHENPGSEIGKTRGHLGSQIERKAETNLRLAKDAAGITTIWTERARHGHIPRDQGQCFEWSDAAGMHVSCGSAKDIKAKAKRQESEEECARALLCFKGAQFTVAEVVAATADALAVSSRTAERRVKEWKIAGLIVAGDGNKWRSGI